MSEPSSLDHHFCSHRSREALLEGSWILRKQGGNFLRHPIRKDVELGALHAIEDRACYGRGRGLRHLERADHVRVDGAGEQLAIRRVVVGAPAYLKQHGTPSEPGDLAGHVCITALARRSGSPWRFVREGKETAVDVAGPVRASTPAALVVLARAGVGLAQLPDWLVADDLRNGRLRQVLAGWDTPAIATWIVHRSEHRQAARVRAFVEAMTGP